LALHQLFEVRNPFARVPLEDGDHACDQQQAGEQGQGTSVENIHEHSPVDT